MAKKSTFNVSLKLLTSEFNKGINNIKRQLRTFGNFVKSAFAIGSITAFGRKMVDVGSQFEDAMARVKAVSNASAKDFDAMKKEAQRLGETTKYTASEAAEALENLTRNGLSAAQATKALAPTLELAGANAISLGEAANIATNTMNAFGLEVKDLSKINDVLSSTCATSATGIQDLYEAMVVAGPYSKIMGKSIEETGAALGVLANNGVKGSSAGKAVAAMYQRLAAITPKAAAELKKYGLEIDENVVKSQDLVTTIKQLGDSGIGNSVEALSNIFGKNFAGSISLLVNNVDELELALKVAAESSGTTARMFSQGIGTTKKNIDTLKSTWEGFLITMSQKTSGVVNGAIKLCTQLINNFKTVGGTIANIASVTVPLLASKFVAMGKTVKTVFAQIKAGAITVQAAMGNWIGIIATAVTWIGSALVTAWNKAHQAMKDAKKEMEHTEAEIITMQGKVQNLIQVLDKNGTDSLGKVVAELVEMFPEFKDAIMDAAAEAGKTGEYDKLKSTLKDIASLQAAVMANASIQGQYNATLGAAAAKLRKASDKDKRKAGLGPLEDYFNNKSNKLTKEQQEAIYAQVLERVVSGQDVSEYISMLTGTSAAGAKFNQNMVDGMASYIGELRTLKHRMEENQNVADGINEKFKKEQDAINAEKSKAQAQADAAAAAADEVKDASKRARQTEESIQKHLETTIANASDDLARGVITAAEKAELMAKAFNDAYEDFRDLTRKTGEDNKYFKDWKNAKSKVDMMAPLPQPSTGIFQAQATTQSGGGLAGERPTNVVTPQISPFNATDVINGFNEGVDAAGQFAFAIGSVASAFDTLNSSQSEWYEKLAAGVQIIQQTEGALEAISAVLDILGVKETIEAAIAKKAAKEKRKESEKNIAANVAEAGAGAASATSSIPVLGPLLAVAATAAIIAGVMALLPKFASGGIVGNGSLHGDKNLVRVNSGEMILNGHQQKRLFDAVNHGGAAGELTFRIQGKDLVGAISNYNKSLGKVRTSL